MGSASATATCCARCGLTTHLQLLLIITFALS